MKKLIATLKVLAKKFTSRKFLVALAGVCVGIAVISGANKDTIETVSGAIVSLISVISYIKIEGRIDAEAVRQAMEAADKLKDAAAAIKGEDDENNS